MKPKFLLILIFFIGTVLFLIYLPSSIKNTKDINMKKKINIELINLNNQLKAQDINQTIRNAVDIYKKYPEYSGPICTFLADIYFSLNDLKGAEWFYREGINKATKNVSCYVKLAFFYRINKNYDSCFIILNECAKFAPFNYLLLNEYAELYYDKKNYQKSNEYLLMLYKYSDEKKVLLNIIKNYYILKDPRYKDYIKDYIHYGGNKEDVKKIITNQE
jgi:hypothetical protein